MTHRIITSALAGIALLAGIAGANAADFSQWDGPVSYKNSGISQFNKREVVAADGSVGILVQDIVDRLKPDATRIVREPEDVECFVVSRKPFRYDGQTMLGYALDGYCDMLETYDAEDLQFNLLFKEENFALKNRVRGIFNPVVVLRFRRGYDFAHVLISNTPAAIKVVYGDHNVVLDSKPGAQFFRDYTTRILAGHKDVPANAGYNRELTDEERKQICSVDAQRKKKRSEINDLRDRLRRKREEEKKPRRRRSRAQLPRKVPTPASEPEAEMEAEPEPEGTPFGGQEISPADSRRDEFGGGGMSARERRLQRMRNR